MFKVVSNTSPFLYLYRIDAFELLPELFEEIATTQAALAELEEGRKRGYDVPALKNYNWLKIINPKVIPSE